MVGIDLISNTAGQLDIESKWEYVQELIVTCDAPIILLAVNKMYSTFIGEIAGKKMLFSYNKEPKTVSATWYSNNGHIKKDCVVTGIDEEFIIMGR